MVLNNCVKIYLPLQYLKDGVLRAVSLNEYDNDLERLASKFGGLSTYEVNGFYYNHVYEKVFGVRTLLAEIFVDDNHLKDLESDIIHLATEIKALFRQESVAYVINDKMYIV